jgi:hypothetical protein
MLSFIKNLFGSKPSQAEVLPAGTEAVMATTEQRYVGENEQGSVYETVVVIPGAVAPAMATTEQRYVGENEQGSVYETVVVIPEAVAPAMTPIPLVVAVTAEKPAKSKAAPKPKALPKIKVPKAPK